MKGSVMILAPLWFLLCWMTPEGSTAPSYDKPTPLSMEDCSVDDMYTGCRDDMMNIVKTEYFDKEKNDVMWDDKVTKECTNNNIKKNKNPHLTKDHLQAICVYTGGRIYKEFTPAVIAERKYYGTKFKYHSLHYLLTTAIQILNPDSAICRTVYRRTDFIYTGKVGDIIRFGLFASSSLNPNLRPESFGSNSCFKVKTCAGAELTDYAHIPEQQEVVIPPYEKFKITNIYDGKGTFPEMDCMRVFILETDGGTSYLNCELVPTKPE